MQQNSKKCKRCLNDKKTSEFYKDNKNSDGLYGKCISCITIETDIRNKTKKGIVNRIYSAQRRKSKERGHQLPTYTLKELRKWMLSKRTYHKLYDEWVKSNYDTLKKPSIDRLDDYKGYSFDNIRIVTWGENWNKEYDDRKNGTNNKLNTPVSKYSKNGKLIQSFHSQSEAERATGIKMNAISRCRRGLQKKAGGFI